MRPLHVFKKIKMFTSMQDFEHNEVQITEILRLRMWEERLLRKKGGRNNKILLS